VTGLRPCLHDVILTFKDDSNFLSTDEILLFSDVIPIGDINNDLLIGLDEAINALQIASGLKSQP